MKKIIICLSLFLITSLSYGEFKYRKDLVYNKCKAQVICCNTSYEDFNNMINNFCDKKKVIDIKYQDTQKVISAIVIYTEED